jgi:AcrR family transcriptional regulator
MTEHAPPPHGESSVARGRPRLPDVDQRILAAALKLMARSGYSRMSIDAVATDAGISKPTLYLRYPSKAALATAALAASREQHPPPPASGDTRADLIAHLRHFQRGVGRPFGISLVGTVLAEERETPELLALYREHVVRPRRQMVRAVLERAREQRELRDDADLDIAVTMLIGAYYAQYLAGDPFPADWAEREVDTLLRGLVRAP